jgi:hypothetical protein
VGKDRPFRGAALPMYGVDTIQEAQSLQVLMCAVSRRDNETYYIPGFGGEVDDIFTTGERFADAHQAMIERRKARANV